MYGVGNLRLNVLPQASGLRIVILSHVPGAASAGSHYWFLEQWSFEIRGVEFGGFGCVGHVACAAAAVR